VDTEFDSYMTCNIVWTECLIVKSQQESKLIEIIMLCWMSGYTRKATNRNKIIRDKIGVSSIVEKDGWTLSCGLGVYGENS